MTREPPHRKRVRHYDDPGHIHELTFSCYQQLALLTTDSWRMMLSHSIEAAVSRLGFRLAAFVYMPEHVHLLVWPADPEAKISALLKAVKQPFSYRVKQVLQEGDQSLLRRLTVRERPGKMAFRFWQEGGGYDRNLTEPKSIRSAVDYIHLNPVRRGLVERAIQWRWSSVRHYYADDELPQDEGLPTVHGLPWDVA